jgi:hypothetical protein
MSENSFSVFDDEELPGLLAPAVELVAMDIGDDSDDLLLLHYMVCYRDRGDCRWA